MADVPTDRDIYETIQSVLASYGIIVGDVPSESNLGNWLWNMIVSDASEERIMREIKNTDEYKARFPAMAYFDENMEGVTEGEYIDRERQYREQIDRLGLNYAGYKSTSYIASLMQNDVSVDELTERVKYAENYISQQAPRSVVEALKSQYGMTDIEMVEYLLNPEDDDLRLSIEYQANLGRAEVMGAAADSGLRLSAGMTDELARSGVGYRQGLMGLQEAASNAAGLRKLSALGGGSITDDEIAATSSQFATVGSVEAKEKKRRLASQERGRFSGSSSIGRGSLARGGLGSQ